MSRTSPIQRLHTSMPLFRIGFEEYARLEIQHGRALLTLADGQPAPPDLAADNDVLFGILSMALTGGDDTPPAAPHRDVQARGVTMSMNSAAEGQDGILGCWW